VSTDWTKEGWRPCEGCGKVHNIVAWELECMRKLLREARAELADARVLLANRDVRPR
jgi:hypothetical protein